MARARCEELGQQLHTANEKSAVDAKQITHLESEVASLTARVTSMTKSIAGAAAVSRLSHRRPRHVQ